MQWDLESGILSLRWWPEETCVLAGPGQAVGLMLSWGLMTKPLCLKAAGWVWTVVHTSSVQSCCFSPSILPEVGTTECLGLWLHNECPPPLANFNDYYLVIITFLLARGKRKTIQPSPFFNHLHICPCPWAHCLYSRGGSQNTMGQYLGKSYHLALEGVLLIVTAD